MIFEAMVDDVLSFSQQVRRLVLPRAGRYGAPAIATLLSPPPFRKGLDGWSSGGPVGGFSSIFLVVGTVSLGVVFFSLIDPAAPDSLYIFVGRSAFFPVLFFRTPVLPGGVAPR